MQTTAHLIDRLARLQAGQSWDGSLNPTQRAALVYLARANRFSRTPSAVADYLATTRGTVSQTLKSLMRKGFLEEHKSEQDKRSIRYDLTNAGAEIASQAHLFDTAMTALTPEDKAALARGLEALARSVLETTGRQTFGLCATCKHHADGPRCALLNVDLSADDAQMICQEHTPAV